MNKLNKEEAIWLLVDIQKATTSRGSWLNGEWSIDDISAIRLNNKFYDYMDDKDYNILDSVVEKGDMLKVVDYFFEEEAIPIVTRFLEKFT